MSQSLLASKSSPVGGGIKSKKFKALPKIPKAKFEMAKFEKAEWQPFEQERAELQHREVTAEVLNWAPDAVSYAPHCLARKSREMITGTTPYEGDATLTAEDRAQDVVG